MCLAQHYSFKEYTTGLGNLNINSIGQDRTGYLWLGTENGLYRFDGTHFREYGPKEGIPSHLIREIYSSPDGTMWVGSTTGLYFQRGDGRFQEVQPPGANGQFTLRMGTALTATADGTVMLVDRRGVYRLSHAGADAWVAEPARLEAKTVWSVLADTSGVLWYGCDNDLCRMQNGQTKRLSAAFHLPADRWRHLLRARDGHLWLWGDFHLEEVIPDEGRSVERELPLPSNESHYVELSEDRQGHVVAMRGHSFGLWDSGRWRMITDHNGLPHFDLSTVFMDREGTMWLGVLGHGLLHWKGQEKWDGLTSLEGLSDDIVWSSARDLQGRLWVSTESGLDWVPAGGETARVWHSKDVQESRALAVAVDTHGGIWMGTGAGTLVRIDPTTLSAKQWKIADVFRVMSDRGGHVWVATVSGLYEVDTNAARVEPRLVEDRSIANPRQFVYDVAIDQADRLWVAVEHGLMCRDETGWHPVTGFKGFPAKGVPELVVADHAGNLWVAGDFSGLMRLRVSGYKVVDTVPIQRPLLLSEQVTALFVDHRGWLWAGQDAGLSVFDGNLWRNLTQDDGLIWNDVNSSGVTEDKDGSIWVGTSGGLAHLLRPESISGGAPSPVVFSEVDFGDSEIHEGAKVPWQVGPLIISVGSLSFRDDRSIRVRYRLLGLHQEWQETAEKTVHYPRLAPGSYKFQAVAVDASSGALSGVTEFSFTVTPRWWQSSWLKVAISLLALAAGGLLWNLSVRVLKAQKRHLEQAVQERTEELEREKAELVRTRELMRRDAERDSLTDLWNRRMIMERLGKEVLRAQRDKRPLSLILIDLDHFKDINDEFGHLAGDLVLKEVAATLAHSVRPYDWVGRYGGEEFMLVFPNSSLANMQVRAEQLRLAVEAMRLPSGESLIQLTASFGLASGMPEDMQSMIKVADQALYDAKAKGRNRVVSVELQGSSVGRSANPVL